LTRVSIISSVLCCRSSLTLFFFFNVPPATEIYTLSLHDALPISSDRPRLCTWRRPAWARSASSTSTWSMPPTSSASCSTGTTTRSEEHTSELQSPYDLVCRLLLEKKNKKI